MSMVFMCQEERKKWALFISALENSCGVITYRIRNAFSRTMSEGLLNEFDKSNALDNLAWCREYRKKWAM